MPCNTSPLCHNARNTKTDDWSDQHSCPEALFMPHDNRGIGIGREGERYGGSEMEEGLNESFCVSGCV
jgi:hypothetical protein